MHSNIKFHEILCISSRDTLATKFLSHTYRHTHTHRQTDIFQKWSKRVQDVSKRVNPSKTGSRKFLRKQYVLLIYMEESKNEVSFQFSLIKYLL